MLQISNCYFWYYQKLNNDDLITSFTRLSSKMSLSDLLNLSSDKKVEIFDDAVRYIFAKYFPGDNVKEPNIPGLKWSVSEDNQLYEEIADNKKITDIAKIHQRTEVEVVSRLKKYALQLYQQGEDMETIISSTLLSKSQIETIVQKTSFENVIKAGQKMEEPKILPKPVQRKTKTASSSNKKEHTGELTQNQEIKFTGLKTWRNQVSKDLEWPAYMVLSNSVLKSIAFYQPQNEEELLSIKGMGEEKVGRYSDAIVEIVNRAAPTRILAPPKKVAKPSTFQNQKAVLVEDYDEEALTYIPPVRFLAKNK